MSELKKCPFCGSKAEVDFSFAGKAEVTVYYVSCLNCECGTKYHKTEEDAIKTWNTRSNLKCTCAWEWPCMTIGDPDDTANIVFRDPKCPVHGGG